MPITGNSGNTLDNQLWMPRAFLLFLNDIRVLNHAFQTQHLGVTVPSSTSRLQKQGFGATMTLFSHVFLIEREVLTLLILAFGCLHETSLGLQNIYLVAS